MGKGGLRGKRRESKKKKRSRKGTLRARTRENLQVKTLAGFRTDDKPDPKAAPGLAAPEASPRQR